MRARTAILELIFCFLSVATVLAQAQDRAPGEPPDAANPGPDSGAKEAKSAADLDLEQLASMEIKVTSASKKEESLFAAPAAISVITAEDIRRGGFTTLPEALRMVPGLYVSQINAHSWQISARGFSGINNDKMLVLVDGRSVYTPLFGGVDWDALDMPLENIDRIEVIRGPGGTLWGANAVNGVINIVTKTAQQTQGYMVSTSADLDLGDVATVQYGGQAGQHVDYRIFGRASYWQPFDSASGPTLPDVFNLSQGGLRMDWAASRKDDVTLEAGSYDGRYRAVPLSATTPSTFLLKGNDVLVHWKRTISDRSSSDLLASCDWYSRQGSVGESRNTCDLEWQNSHAFSDRHSLIWGGAFSTSGDNLKANPLPFAPEQRRTNTVSGFAQYEFAVVPDRLRILAGSKLEHNDYSGAEYQPQIRAVWTPRKTTAVWGGVSRAVRVPVRAESDLHDLFPAGVEDGLPFFLFYTGNPHLPSEHLVAEELGYRYQPSAAVSFDLSLFYNHYGNLISESAVPIIEVLPTMILGTVPFVSGGRAETHGAELSVEWRPNRHWKLSPGITEVRGSPTATLNTPRHVLDAQSRFDLPHRIEFDSGYYYADALPVQANALNASSPPRGNPTLNRVDVGLAWHATPQWTLAVWGRNLQSQQHIEALDSVVAGEAGEVPRSVAFKLLWQPKPERKPAK